MGRKVNIIVENKESGNNVVLHINAVSSDPEEVVRAIASKSYGATSFVSELLNYGMDKSSYDADHFWIDLEPFRDYEYILKVDAELEEGVKIGLKVERMDDETIFDEPEWIKTNDGWSDNGGGFCIKDGELGVFIDRGTYHIAKGDDEHLFAMAKKYLKMLGEGTSVSGLDTVDIMPLPEVDKIRVAKEGFNEWGEPISYVEFLGGGR